MYVTYVLYSKKYHKIYIGYTSQLIKRFHSHNRLATKGWTIKYRPWEVIYLEFFEIKQEAIRREKELKTTRGRDFISKLIV